MTTFQVVFEAVMGSDYLGDISIDSFGVYEFACPSPGECDFEELCTWRNTELNDDIDWMQGSGRSNTADQSGPQSDHTSGNENGTEIVRVLMKS